MSCACRPCLPCLPIIPTPLYPRRAGFGGASPVNPLPAPSRIMGIGSAPSAAPKISSLIPSSSGCRPHLTTPWTPGKSGIPPSRSFGHSSVGSPGQISLSAYRTPTESTLGMWMLTYHRRHRKMTPSPSAVGIPALPIASRYLSSGSSSMPGVPCLLCHR